MKIQMGVGKGKEKSFQTVLKAQLRLKNSTFMVRKMCIDLCKVQG